MKINYSQSGTPTEYTCNTCGASGVKLWREYNVCNPFLFCAKCAAESQGKSIATMKPDGSRIDEHDFLTDQIGFLVPAIPDEEGIGYWGYTSTPTDGVNWWRALPNE